MWSVRSHRRGAAQQGHADRRAPQRRSRLMAKDVERNRFAVAPADAVAGPGDTVMIAHATACDGWGCVSAVARVRFAHWSRRTGLLTDRSFTGDDSASDANASVSKLLALSEERRHPRWHRCGWSASASSTSMTWPCTSRCATATRVLQEVVRAPTREHSVPFPRAAIECPLESNKLATRLRSTDSIRTKPRAARRRTSSIRAASSG